MQCFPGKETEAVCHYICMKVKDENCRKRLDFELSNFPSSKESADSSPCTGNKSGSGKKSGSCGLATELIQVTRLKQKNNITAAREVKNKIKERYKSLRQAHRENFPHKSWKWMHNVFTPRIRHAKCRVSDVGVQNIQNFYLSPAVSFQLPIKKLSNNYYLNLT